MSDVCVEATESNHTNEPLSKPIHHVPVMGESFDPLDSKHQEKSFTREKSGKVSIINTIKTLRKFTQ